MCKAENKHQIHTIDWAWHTIQSLSSTSSVYVRMTNLSMILKFHKKSRIRQPLRLCCLTKLIKTRSEKQFISAMLNSQVKLLQICWYIPYYPISTSHVLLKNQRKMGKSWPEIETKKSRRMRKAEITDDGRKWTEIFAVNIFWNFPKIWRNKNRHN